MKKKLSLLLCAMFMVSALSACANKPVGSVSTSTSQQDSQPSSVSSVPAPLPQYEANVLTGLEKDSAYPEGQRVTAIMVNNISTCRPQRGLSQAEMLFEIQVEGGITRFMGMFNDYKNLADVGPVRSARDQFFKLIVPFQPIYVHVGESVVQKQLIADLDYHELNVDGNRGNIIYRDQGRLDAGYSLDSTAYTNGELISQFISDKEIDDQRTYKSTFFDFVNYDEPARVLANAGAKFVDITHSASYHTYFEYDESMQRYQMSQWNGNKKVKHKTVDENNGVQLSFENLFVLFTDIHVYPGHEVKGLQYVDYDFGGVGYYFNGGRYEEIRWAKGNSALSPLLIFDKDGNESSVQVNPGRSYVSVVDLDEYEGKFKYYDGDTQQNVGSIASEGNVKESED